MPNAAEDIRAARLLLANRHNQTGVPSDLDVRRADAHAEVATATALDRIAIGLEALAADTQPSIRATPWPAGVTARILTRVGIRSREFADATVDITDTPRDGTRDGRSTALCRPCGWSKDNGLTYRNTVLEWAREHAADCTALPNPNA